MAAQMKALFDATGQLWVKGSLVGKPAGVFVSVGTQVGRQCAPRFAPYFAFCDA
jgi:NAD(P)H dehydrogenase (quinone)